MNSILASLLLITVFPLPTLARAAETECSLRCKAINEAKEFGRCELWGMKDVGYRIVFREVPKNLAARGKLMHQEAAGACGAGTMIEIHSAEATKSFTGCSLPTRRSGSNRPECEVVEIKYSITKQKAAKRLVGSP